VGQVFLELDISFCNILIMQFELPAITIRNEQKLTFLYIPKIFAQILLKIVMNGFTKPKRGIPIFNLVCPQ
jgi:hypothetical protein